MWGKVVTDFKALPRYSPRRAEESQENTSHNILKLLLLSEEHIASIFRVEVCRRRNPLI
jgi:hypothetical protein